MLCRNILVALNGILNFLNAQIQMNFLMFYKLNFMKVYAYSFLLEIIGRHVDRAQKMSHVLLKNFRTKNLIAGMI